MIGFIVGKLTGRCWKWNWYCKYKHTKNKTLHCKISNMFSRHNSGKKDSKNFLLMYRRNIKSEAEQKQKLLLFILFIITKIYKINFNFFIIRSKKIYLVLIKESPPNVWIKLEKHSWYGILYFLNIPNFTYLRIWFSFYYS